MSNARIFWIIWCTAWALFWFCAGWVTLGIAWLLVPFSLLAILIPVGGGTVQPPGPIPWWPAETEHRRPPT